MATYWFQVQTKSFNLKKLCCDSNYLVVGERHFTKEEEEEVVKVNQALESRES
jgi:hypothetical protein